MLVWLSRAGQAVSFADLAIYVISILINRSPLVLFSGLGALSAVILLIFKDSILGLVAGIQLSANDMVRRGDWIEMPKYGADGDVIDIDGCDWRIIVGTGHSPEHACLYRMNDHVLISGDQILPKITPNVSVWPQIPGVNPLEQFLESLDKFRGL